MAALNVSPESFYGGSVKLDDGALVETAQAAVAAGADIIDIGAMTTAPYLQGAVSAEEERRRLTHAVASAEANRTRNLRVQQSHEAEGSHASKRMLP